MRAVILTAGEGTRMRPLTLTRPKTMLPVGGKPLLEYTVEALKEAGIKNITMIVGYQKEAVKDYFKDGTSLGVNIDYVIQEERLGTAHAIGQIYGTLKEDDDAVIVTNGDIILGHRLIESLMTKFYESQAQSILVLTQVDDPSSFGVVELEGDHIKDIVEKPSLEDAPSNLINAGIYLFDRNIFKAIEKTEKSERGEYEITDSLKIQINKGKKVLGLVSQDKWIDVGRPWEFLELNEHFLELSESKIEGEIEEGATIHGPIILKKDSIIRSGTYIMGPVYIGENCDIGPNTFLRKHTSIGNNVNVGNAVEIKNSIIMDGTNVNHLSYVGDSIIGADCNIAAGTNIANLRFDDEGVKVTVKGKRIDSGRRKMGVIFADGVKTGINSSFNPGVTIGLNSSIGSGAIIYRDIPDNKIVIHHQTQEMMDKK
ncbi:bifunctional sugar-1-phosphate nucleotidylyltransferase/acetyltransferase [Methanobacterium ferruginis]|uniref:bifunctional sugar-1-phosphate nucleotidylyltransferase/acetyltransferase n=1 Tax=Methanobacterium ferruginis TaxID=710191 RepID=UPI0025743E7E|nr:bifunctional sugar-1-phosphate nucleotidylyltransferase/acetyltransferase [Methanobacterium ferruginis]MCC7549909.1 NTP transferase domain-containing protein [Methanobacterium sp.]BDZ67851.1 glucose-1-phosphate thymidylyltransferase [Methanobacterium ferruginis]